LQQLAKRIKERRLQTILVRTDETLGNYAITNGERRYRACQLSGLATVDSVVVEGEIIESDVRRTQLIENR
jgi:ParB/RepB/Spo0J family partition protein